MNARGMECGAGGCKSAETPAACLHLQTSELLKTLLDPETMETVIEKNEFVELFYDK